jgi:hypothetical protein
MEGCIALMPRVPASRALRSHSIIGHCPQRHQRTWEHRGTDTTVGATIDAAGKRKQQRSDTTTRPDQSVSRLHVRCSLCYGCRSSAIFRKKERARSRVTLRVICAEMTELVEIEHQDAPVMAGLERLSPRVPSPSGPRRQTWGGAVLDWRSLFSAVIVVKAE